MQKREINYQKFIKNLKLHYHLGLEKIQNEKLFNKLPIKAVFNPFYVHYAIIKGAPRSMPYYTLCLLGEKLFNPAYKDDFQNIINQNIIKYKGQFYKLDDQLSQPKIQKAIKNYHFNECQEIKAA